MVDKWMVYFMKNPQDRWFGWFIMDNPMKTDDLEVPPWIGNLQMMTYLWFMVGITILNRGL